MKKIIFTLILFSLIISAAAQRKRIDTLRAKLNQNLDDTTRLQTMLDLSQSYYLANPDSNIIISQQAYKLAAKRGLLKYQGRALNDMATGYASLGDYPKGVQMLFKALRISETLHEVTNVIIAYNNLGDTYIRQGNYRKALDNLLPAYKQLREYLPGRKLVTRRDRQLESILVLNIGECYLDLGKIDSADSYLQQSFKAAQKQKFDDVLNNVDRDLGEVEIARGHKDKALKHLHNAIDLSISVDDPQMLSESYLSEAKLYHKNKQQDSALYYAQKALDVASKNKFEQDVLNAGNVLYAYYDEDRNLPLAYKYFRMATAAKDSIYSQEKVKQLLSLDFEEKQRQQEIVAAQEQYRATVRMYALIGGLVVLLLLAIVFWRNSNQRKKANQLLQNQKEEIQTTLGELKTTQNQLVQSAKMASLGELTAGIAHEIQNPLNFVNNFSEVNTEMLEELKAESKKPKAERNDQLENGLIDDLIENEKKINHHGRRADFIVKGMLEHSRNSTGERQVTNLNVLADEFLKLSYHGLKAKDKSFNSELVTNFDDKLPRLNIVQQDIGRVLINLFSNAFYAVNQKAKTSGSDYKPTVEVSTAQQNGSIMISVKDNGTGIPENIREKIMQPFFTTKPTGEGTGLGLSLSYDIVVKAHGGKINVESREGNGSEFTVTLPA
ncbi:MAG TPA: ATP-binding protein [Mucilaginibacter sp.]|jgi:signal transduction histidine kinase|nr:ATP-binding protein [Mucilaginibacter sp.]